MNKSKILKVSIILGIIFLAAGTYLYAGEDFNPERPVEYAGTVSDGGAKIGLAAPKFAIESLKIESIEDLKNPEISEKFDNKIYGIDPGAGITGASKEAIKDYGLDDYEFVISSEAGMLVELKSSVEEKKPVLVTIWDPHWAVSEYNTVYLKDPKGSYGGAESIESWTRAGLLEEDPAIAKLLSQYTFLDDEFNELLNYIEYSDKSIEEATKIWIEENRDIVDNRWLSGIDKKDAKGGEIDIGLVPWACAMGSSNVLKHLLDELGYHTRLTYVDAGVLFTGMAYGVTDITTTVWTPTTHNDYLNRYAGSDWKSEFDERQGKSETEN